MTGIFRVLITILCVAFVLAGSQDDRGRAAAAEALPADLDLVPRDAYGFASVRVADLWQSAAGAALRKTLAAQQPDFLKGMEKALGITLADIERGTIVGKGPKLGSVGILAATKPLDRAKVLATFGQEKAEEKKVQGGSYYEEPGPGAVIYFPGERIFLITPFAVEKVKRGAGKEYVDWAVAQRADGPLAAPLALAAGKHHVTVALLPAAVKEWVGDVPADYRALESLLQVRQAAATVHFNQDNLAAEVQFAFATDQQARDGEKAAKAAQVLLQTAVADGIKKLADRQEPPARIAVLAQLLNLVAPAIKDGAVKRQDTIVLVSLTAKGKESANVLSLIAEYYFVKDK